MNRPPQKRFVLWVVLALLLGACVPGYAEVTTASDDTEPALARGLTEYRMEHFEAACSDFLHVIGSSTSSERISAAQVMLAKSLFREGMFAPADSVARSLRMRYPDGLYTDWTYYLEAACALRTGNAEQALSVLVRLAGNARDAAVRSRSFRALKYTMIPIVGEARVIDELAKHGVNSSMLADAEPYGITDVFSTEDEIRPSAKASATKKSETPVRKKEPIRIGLIAPVTGVNSGLGNQLLRGVRAALPETLTVGGEPVTLLIEDAGSDPVGSVLAARKLAERGVSAIIGPVYSTPSISAAVESNARGIPFIAPTATDTGLTGIGKYVFQLNFTPAVQGERLAALAIDTLNVRTVAVIASRDSWGESIAAGFTREAKKRGAHVVQTAFFTPDFETDEDAKIVRDIRDRAQKPADFTDSVLVRTAPADSTGREFRYYSSRDLSDINTVDVILISATPADAVRFASRIMQYNLDTTLLGDSGWNTPDIPENGKQFVDGAYLVAPAGELSRGRGAFFLENTSKNDNRELVAMKGYDAGALLLQCLRTGARTPEEITRALREVKDFMGASSRITIDSERRVNTAVEFVRIQDRKYETVLPDR